MNITSQFYLLLVCITFLFLACFSPFPFLLCQLRINLVSNSRDLEENGAPGLLSDRSSENQESIWNIDEENLNRTEVIIILVYSFETVFL